LTAITSETVSTQSTETAGEEDEAAPAAVQVSQSPDAGGASALPAPESQPSPEPAGPADQADPADDPERAEQLPEFDMVAYRVSGRHVGPVEPAAVRRAWMDETDARFANRCLPLLMANQSGWWLLNTHDFEATWDGGPDKLATRLTYGPGRPPYPAASHFGYGVVTFHVPLLIRTSPGWNLLVRGPANYPKDGATALEGLVETDWAVATFTMNWKLTRPGLTVRFAKGEPFCLLVPQRRGELEDFRPRFGPVEMMPDRNGYETWRTSRAEFLRDRQRPAPEGERRNGPDWQRDYMHGTDPAAAANGWRFEQHQRRLTLRPFADPHPLRPVRRCGGPSGPAGSASPAAAPREASQAPDSAGPEKAPKAGPAAAPGPEPDRLSQTSNSSADRSDRVMPP
jgi:hypothetical protein